MRWYPRRREDQWLRVWLQVEWSGKEECWLWQGPPGPFGYGTARWDGTAVRAHRLIYEIFVGPIPDGLHLDHLCHNRDDGCVGGVGCSHRRCVNPNHLEPVTAKENLLRGKGFIGTNAAKTHCKHGHEFTESNTYIVPGRGGRQCRACGLAATKAWQAVHIPKAKYRYPNAFKKHCKRGHEFSEANTYVNKTTGSRQCRACKKGAR